MKLFFDPLVAGDAALAARYEHDFVLTPLPASGFESEQEGSAALLARNGRLQLVDLSVAPPQSVYLEAKVIERRASLRSDLARACGLNRHKDLCIVDACAGWGMDGLALAATGARVVLLERERPIWALLDDLLRQRDWGRVEHHCIDALEWLSQPPIPCDVVYLDPMFPQRNKTALPKQRLQLLARLAKASAEPEALLEAALAVARKRVVLKRRRKDPVVAPPDWQIVGKTVRYDSYAAA